MKATPWQYLPWLQEAKMNCLSSDIFFSFPCDKILQIFKSIKEGLYYLLDFLDFFHLNFSPMSYRQCFNALSLSLANGVVLTWVI